MMKNKNFDYTKMSKHQCIAKAFEMRRNPKISGNNGGIEQRSGLTSKYLSKSSTNLRAVDNNGID